MCKIPNCCYVLTFYNKNNSEITQQCIMIHYIYLYFWKRAQQRNKYYIAYNGQERGIIRLWFHMESFVKRANLIQFMCVIWIPALYCSPWKITCLFSVIYNVFILLYLYFFFLYLTFCRNGPQHQNGRMSLRIFFISWCAAVLIWIPSLALLVNKRSWKRIDLLPLFPRHHILVSL